MDGRKDYPAKISARPVRFYWTKKPADDLEPVLLVDGLQDLHVPLRRDEAGRDIFGRRKPIKVMKQAGACGVRVEEDWSTVAPILFDPFGIRLNIHVRQDEIGFTGTPGLLPAAGRQRLNEHVGLLLMIKDKEIPVVSQVNFSESQYTSCASSSYKICKVAEYFL